MKSRMNLNQIEIENIINSCLVCNVAMVDKNGLPYVLPFNFGYQDNIIYLHSAPEGKKLDILTHNNNVCLSFSNDYKMHIQSESLACSYSMKYKSVLVFGEVQFVDDEDIDLKQEILTIIMKKYAPNNSGYKFGLPALKNVKVFFVEAKKIEGKAYGY